MSGSQFINHKGKNIFLMEYPGEIDQLKKMIGEAKKTIATQSPQSVLALSDLRQVDLTNETTEIFKDFTNHNKPYIKASALVGISGMKKIIVNTISTLYRRNFKIFDTVDEAKNYLALV
ncbi:MAG: hypothetical protein A2Y40_00145 [Candidatus Margulisbacteria bacterium GWF2_35_9]|nr:MAG: hypothetical protein A2Y40_00145 [Candidatus Margulisbacteria bacterium GWF2_35_9]